MRSVRTTGVLLVVVSAIAFSSAGLFIKAADADIWSIIFWRALSAVGFTTLYLGYKGTIRRETLGIGMPGIAAGVVGGAASIAFVASYKFTTIANVSLIYAAAPFIAGLMMWVWIRERPSPSVLWASIAAFLGVLIIVAGSLGGLHLKGDLLALWMTVGMSLYLCFYRRYPDLPTAGPAVLSQIVLIPVCLLMTNPLNITIGTLLLIVAFGLVFVIAAITLAEGASRLPVSETTLLSTIETPLAPIWAFLLLAEIPTAMTVVGGVVILAAVLFSQRDQPGLQSEK